MSTITRGGFQRTFENGIELDDPDLKHRLAGTPISERDLRRADLDRDGVIAGGSELNRLFDVVDGVDVNGSARSFSNTGDAGAVYAALLEGRRPPPFFGKEIVQAARDRILSDGPDYAYDRAPTSPLHGLSGNTVPGVSHPEWLEGQNKCSTFVGDVMTQAGVRAPTVTMADGSLHYASAEAWPTRTDLFDRVTSVLDIKPGDVIMRDNTAERGPSTAHVEVVTGINPMRTTGAHFEGAWERSGDWLANTTYDPISQTWSRGSHEIHILRPKKRISE